MKKKIFFMLITMVILLTPSVIYAHTSPQGNGNTNFINAFFFYNAFPPSGQNIIIRDYFDNSGDPIIYNPGNVPLDAEVSFSKAVMGDVKVRRVSTSAEVFSIATKVSFGTSYHYQWNGLDSGTGKTAADGDYYLQVYAYESEATKNTAFDIQHVHIKIQRSTGTGETKTLTIYSLSPDKSQYAITDTINVKFIVVDSGSIVVSGAEVTAIWKDPNGVISQPMTCTTDGSGVCSKQFTSVTQAAGKYVVTATAAKTGYTTSDSKTLEVQVGTTGTSPVATNIPTCDSYCKGKEFKGGQCLATIPADWKYVDQGVLLKNVVSDCDAGQHCVCERKPTSCEQACKNKAAIWGDCLQTGSSSYRTAAGYDSCTRCTGVGKIYCVESSQCVDASSPIACKTKIADRQGCEALNPYTQYSIQQPQSQEYMFTLPGDQAQYGCLPWETCVCTRTPLGSGEAFAVALDKSCVKGRNYNIVNVLIVWGGTKARYASVNFVGSYVYGSYGQFSVPATTQLPGISYGGFYGGSCGGLHESSPLATGSYEVPAGQQALYYLQHIIPCTTQIYGTSDTVQGYVTLYDENRVPLTGAIVPIIIECKGAPQITIPTPIELPPSTGGLPSAKISKISCNGERDYDWSMVDFDDSTGFTTAASGYCEIVFEKQQAFSAIELKTDKDVKINRVVVGGKAFDVYKDAKADEIFRYNFVTTAGSVIRVEYGTGAGSDCICTAEYAPVCGADGQDYTNTCWAQCAGVGIACRGQCPCPSATEEKYLCRYNTSSEVHYYCYRSDKCDDIGRSGTLFEDMGSVSECKASCQAIPQVYACDHSSVGNLTNESKYLCGYQKEDKNVFYCHTSNQCNDTRGGNLSYAFDNKDKCFAGCRRMTEAVKCDIQQNTITGSVTGRATATTGRITFKEINPFPDSIEVVANTDPQVTIENNPIGVTGYLRKKTYTEMGQRLTCTANYVTGPYPEGCKGAVKIGFFYKKVVSNCKPGLPGYPKDAAQKECNNGADMTAQLLLALADAYAKIEKARATGTSTVSNPVTEPELIPAESTPIEPSTPDTTPISIEPAHVIDRGKNLLLNPVTGQATGSNYITGKVIDPGTAIVISAAIQAIFSIFSGQQAQKAAANIGYCRYEREYPTQCLANGEPRCERGDPKYPTLGVNIDPNNLPTNVNEVVASHIYSIATDFSTCRYFAPTKPAETLQALVKVTLYKGHITPPGKTVDCSTQDADGCIVWVKDVQTDINGTFLFQLSAPEPGRYTLFYEARSD